MGVRFKKTKVHEVNEGKVHFLTEMQQEMLRAQMQHEGASGGLGPADVHPLKEA